jgi:hypothetical protein
MGTPESRNIATMGGTFVHRKDQDCRENGKHRAFDAWRETPFLSRRTRRAYNAVVAAVSAALPGFIILRSTLDAWRSA